MNPRVGKQRRVSWTEKVACFFDRWRLKNYGDFKHLSPSKISAKKNCQNWGNPYSEIPKFGSSTIKSRSTFFLRGSCSASAGAPLGYVLNCRVRPSNGCALETVSTADEIMQKGRVGNALSFHFCITMRRGMELCLVQKVIFGLEKRCAFRRFLVKSGNNVTKLLTNQ